MIRQNLYRDDAVVTYSELFVGAGLPGLPDIFERGGAGAISTFMKLFHKRCEELGLPPLDALVVQKSDGLSVPGEGYFTLNGHQSPTSGSADHVVAAYDFLRTQQSQVRRWYKDLGSGRVASPL